MSILQTLVLTGTDADAPQPELSFFYTDLFNLRSFVASGFPLYSVSFSSIYRNTDH
jgi:hypothetical protein